MIRSLVNYSRRVLQHRSLVMPTWFKFSEPGVPVVAQGKWIRLLSMRTQVRSLSSLIGRDPALPRLWRRPVATALIWPLAWELPYATGYGSSKKKIKKKKKASRDIWKGRDCVKGERYGPPWAQRWITSICRFYATEKCVMKIVSDLPFQKRCAWLEEYVGERGCRRQTGTGSPPLRATWKHTRRWRWKGEWEGWAAGCESGGNKCGQRRKWQQRLQQWA